MEGHYLPHKLKPEARKEALRLQEKREKLLDLAATYEDKPKDYANIIARSHILWAADDLTGQFVRITNGLRIWEPLPDA